MRPIFTATTLMAFGLLIAGCNQSSDQIDSQGVPPTFGPAAAGGGAQQPSAPLLEVLMSRPEFVLHQGVRQVTLAGEFDPLVFTEEVSCDGNGGFYLEPLQVLSGHHDPALFLVLESGRAPFAFRYRDFRVDNPNRFQATHLISELGPGQVAGVTTIRLKVWRREGGEFNWVVDVDPLSGLILASEEWRGITLLARVEFLSLDLQPDLTGLPIGDHLFARTVLDPSIDLANQLGYKVLVPTLLPHGFQMETASVVLPTPGDPADKWIRSEYGDGLGRVVLLQRRQDLSELFNGAALGEVRVDQIGAWTIVTGSLDAHEIILAGKVSEDSLLEMLQSAL
jgi:hypothetical protein